MVLDVVNFGLFNGSTADHRWKLGLVFTPHRLLAIWGPWGGEASCSPRRGDIPAALPGGPGQTSDGGSFSRPLS